MHNTIDQSGTGERDEPGSSAEGDVPPEPSGETHPAPHLQHAIDIDAGPLTLDQAQALCDLIDTACGHLGRSVERVCVQVVDDAAMIELHRQWHDLDTTTDVLTFESTTKGPIDVDIAVCVDEARRQADGRGHDWQDELLLYVLHGLLHCCGHDDHDPADQARMYAAQDQLLQAIGRGAISGDLS